MIGTTIREHAMRMRAKTRRPRATVGALAFCLAAFGCGGSPAEPGPALSLDVEASRVAGGVMLVNATAQPIAYAVWNSGWLALFAPCTDTGPDCPRLAPGGSVTVREAEIDGWAQGATEAIVRWWTVEPDGSGGARAGQVHEILVPL